MLHVSIEGEWSALDFSEYFAAIDKTYGVIALIEVERRSAREMERFYRDAIEFSPKEFRYARRFMLLRGPNALGYPGFGGGTLLDVSAYKDPAALLDDDEKLKVRRCTYASPGATDFTGMGQALGHVKDILLKCIEVCTGRRERNLKNDILEQQRDAEVLKNVKERLAILKGLGYSDMQCRQVLAEVSPAVAKLEALASRGLVIGASVEGSDG